MSDNLNSTNYEEMITKLGGDVNALPDGLETTYLKEIIKLSGGSVDDLPDNLKSTYLKRLSEVAGSGSGGVKIQPVTNLTLSNKGVLSWNSPDISEITSKGYTVTLSYDVYVNGEFKLNKTITSVSLAEYFIEGENTIKVVAKAEVKYFESDGNEIVETWTVPAEVTVITLSATLPTTNGTPATAVINNKVYIFGGYGGSSSKNTNLDTIVEFDPTNNTVTTLSAKLPTATNGIVAIVINDKAYIFGGYPWTKEILEFDPNTNTVTTSSAKLPSSLMSVSTAVINGKIYIFGGNNAGTLVNTILELDPNTNTVTTLSATLPTTMSSARGVSINNKAYIFGGAGAYDGSSYPYYDTIVEFDPTNNTVTTLSAKLPTATSDVSVEVINGKVYIFGGYGGSASTRLDTIVEFDPYTNTVTTLSAKLPYKMTCSSAVANDKVYIFGGFDGKNYLNTILRVDNLG